MPAWMGPKHQMMQAALAMILGATAASGIPNSRESGEEASKEAAGTPAITMAPGPEPTLKLGELAALKIKPPERAGNSPGNSSNADLPAQSDPRTTPFSPAAELNSHLPLWLRFSGEYRARLEEGFSLKSRPFSADSGHTYCLNRFRVGVTIQPARRLMCRDCINSPTGSNSEPASVASFPALLSNGLQLAMDITILI